MRRFFSVSQSKVGRLKTERKKREWRGRGERGRDGGGRREGWGREGGKEGGGVDGAGVANLQGITLREIRTRARVRHCGRGRRLSWQGRYAPKSCGGSEFGLD